LLKLSDPDLEGTPRQGVSPGGAEDFLIPLIVYFNTAGYFCCFCYF
jgi:hypothetical protein